jgi:GTPase SAR1 family protein
MLVYDVTDYESWRYVQKLGLDLLSKKMTFAVPIVFAGTKADLANKRVDVEEATMMTSVYKFAALIETSAKNSNNVVAAFDTLLEKMLQVEELKPGANGQAAHKKKECKVS